MKYHEFEGQMGEIILEKEIPEELQAKADEARELMIEAVS